MPPLLSGYWADPVARCSSAAGPSCVSAVAGSGKTTTLVESCDRLLRAKPNERTAFLAFNRSIATELRYLRQRSVKDRNAIAVGARIPLQAAISEPTAALGIAQLARLDSILERRKEVERHYRLELSSFEGIKPPYRAPDVDEVHWMLYVVHLGKRFTASALAQIVDDLATECVEVVPYCQPLHQQFAYTQQGHQRGQLPLTERIADRALALFDIIAALTYGFIVGDQVRLYKWQLGGLVC